MATVDDLFDSVSEIKLSEELPKLILARPDKITVPIIEQKKLGQLSTGDKITPSYARAYYAKKKYWQYNSMAGYGTPDGRLTGTYDEGLEVTADEEKYEVESNVPYAQEESLTQYGDNFIRLSEANIEKYCDEYLSPAIQTYITEKTGLVFE